MIRVGCPIGAHLFTSMLEKLALPRVPTLTALSFAHTPSAILALESTQTYPGSMAFTGKNVLISGGSGRQLEYKRVSKRKVGEGTINMSEERYEGRCEPPCHSCLHLAQRSHGRHSECS